MPRAKKTEQEIKVMRARILDAALALLRDEGPAGVSTRKIAERIGVSHMLLYSYFKNRAEIIQSLRERGFEEMETFCAESLRRAETGDALTQVRALLERFIRISHEHPMLYQLAWRHDLSLQADPQNVTTILEHLSRLIQLSSERGQCIHRDPRLAATMAFSVVNGTLMLYHSLPALAQTDQAQLETEIIDAAIAYLKQPAE